MPPSSHNSFGPTRQRGVVTILTASLLMLLLLVMVLALDTGRLYLEKRKLQNIADMAVLSTVAREPQTCTLKTDKDEEVEVEVEVEDAAEDAAEENGFLNNGDWSLDVSCEDQRVKVTATHNVPKSIVLGGIFNDEPLPLTATASAQRNEPIAAFTVSSQLLSLDSDQLVGQLLRNLGLSVEHLAILSSEALLSATITPAGLLSALNIDISVEDLELLTTGNLAKIQNLEVSQIIIKSIEAAGEKALALDIAGSIATLEKIDLFGDNGIIKLSAGQDNSIDEIRAALETQISLKNLLGVTALASTSQAGLDVNLNVLGIANTSVSVIEPPAFAIGPVGTEAQTSQVRLHIEILRIPITLNLVSANATLTEISCSGSPRTATFEVESSIATACVANEQNSPSSEQFCSASSRQDSLNNLLPDADGDYPLLPPVENSINPVFPELTIDENASKSVSNGTDSLLTNLLTSLQQSLNSTSNELKKCQSLSIISWLLCTLGNVLGITLQALASVLAALTSLLNEVTSILENILSLLLNPLIALLGLEIGNTEVYVESISCGVPILVE